MSNVTKFEKTLYANIQTTTAPNPRLAGAITSSGTTITLTSGLLTQAGVKPTENVIFSILNRDTGYVENCYVTSANISSDGKTLSNVVRGIARSGETGVDLTTSIPANCSAHPQDSEVRVVISGLIFEMMADCLQGNLASGGTSWQIGDGTDVNVTVYAANGDASKPFFQYNSATNQWTYSNDGVSSTPFGTGAGVTGGDGITVTAGDIDVDLTDTTTFVQTSSGAGDSGKVPSLNASGQLADGFINGTVNIFGDGSDGAVTISVNTNLSRDMYYTTLVVNNGVTLSTKGFKIFASTSVTNNGTIDCSGGVGGNGTAGNNGTGGGVGAGAAGGSAGAVAGAVGSIYGGTVGVVGSNGTAGAKSGSGGAASSSGTTGTAATQAIGTNNGTTGGVGGTGGAAAGGITGAAAGSGGPGGTTTQSVTRPRDVITAIRQLATDGATIGILKSQASGGAGSGGTGGGSSDGSNTGGGGGGGGSGASGGVILVVAKTITNSGTISANGGAGGTGGAGSNDENGKKSGGAGGGGAGGNGGSIILIGKTVTAGTLTVTGGTAGAAGTLASGTAANVAPTAATAGTAGAAGTTLTLTV